jgi:hypothetical protein
VLSAHLLNALLAECLESSVILTSVNSEQESLDSVLLHSQQSSSALCAYAQCPLGRALTELLRDSVCNCVSHTQPYLQGIQQP